jgi:N-methylhydantoinase A
MAAKKQYIIGVDTGGTFTDVVVLSNDGEVWTAKASTTPDDFSRGVMDRRSGARASVETNELPGRTTLLKHGSTVGTNAITRRSESRLHHHQRIRRHDEIMRAFGRVDSPPEEEIRHVTWVTKPIPRRERESVRERIDYLGQEVQPNPEM